MSEPIYFEMTKFPPNLVFSNRVERFRQLLPLETKEDEDKINAALKIKHLEFSEIEDHLDEFSHDKILISIDEKGITVLCRG